MVAKIRNTIWGVGSRSSGRPSTLLASDLCGKVWLDWGGYSAGWTVKLKSRSVCVSIRSWLRCGGSIHHHIEVSTMSTVLQLRAGGRRWPCIEMELRTSLGRIRIQGHNRRRKLLLGCSRGAS